MLTINQVVMHDEGLRLDSVREVVYKVSCVCI